ncbi:MAG: peptide chain release factor N(5)-glutamine methyltransferase [Deltaproteobacteria bacterium]|nr:peptide chain release factor N(5)-glutamine methyltransferase [Deltaproteobacteria bacterium]
MQNPTNSIKPEWTIIKLLKWTTSYFKSREIESPRATAEILLAHILELKRIDLYLQYDQPLCAEELSRFKALIKRRVKREPVAYILGFKEFWSMDFAVTKDVLIPRPETEFLVEAGLKLLPEGSMSKQNLTRKRILELGTGSGAVILALASMRPHHLFFASDRAIAAAVQAKQNAERHALHGCVIFFCSDWFGTFGNGKPVFDVIVSNPPYVPSGVIAGLKPEINRYEPISALDGGEDGLSSLRSIVNAAHRHLCREGCLLLEIGHDQKDDILKIIEQSGNYEKVIFTKDYSGYDRIVQMQKKRT